MYDRQLMFVRATGPSSVTLEAYGGSTGVSMPVDVPGDIIKQLIGRQCWVKGGPGDICEILKWEPLPQWTNLEVK